MLTAYGILFYLSVLFFPSVQAKAYDRQYVTQGFTASAAS